MRIREIEDSDLEPVLALLLEGFPHRGESYWRDGLANLRRLPSLTPYPRYGYVVDADGGCQGVILLITSIGDGGPRSNLSSWYVRPRYRKYAALLYRHALKRRGTTFLNLSPSTHITPIIDAFGFKPYTSGVVLMDLRRALRAASSGTRIRSFTQGSAQLLSPYDYARAERHISYGCSALVAERGGAAQLILYRMRWLKGIVPCAQILYGKPADLADLATPLFRCLLTRGAPLALFDVSTSEAPPQIGRFYPGQHVRYFRGPAPPVTGDLCDTELAILGP